MCSGNQRCRYHYLKKVRYTRLRPHIHLLEREDKVYLVADDIIQVSSPNDGARHALRLLSRREGIEDGELAQITSDASEMLDKLGALDILQVSPKPFTRVPTTTVDAYYDATLPNPDARPYPALQAILLIGCGGLGGEVAQHLVASGIGRLTLVDADVVHATNLNRQYLFDVSDIGKPKVEAARDRLTRLRPDVKIHAVRSYINRVEDLRELNLGRFDAIICCADTPPPTIASTVARYAFEQGSLFGSATVGILQGSWGPIMEPRMELNYEEWRARHVVSEISGALGPPTASFGPTNSFVAAAFSRDLLHVLSGDSAPSLGARVVFDFSTLHIERSLAI